MRAEVIAAWIATGVIVLVGAIALTLIGKWYREDRKRSNEIREKFGLPPW